jgi:hypothetical protein
LKNFAPLIVFTENSNPSACEAEIKEISYHVRRESYLVGAEAAVSHTRVQKLLGILLVQ